MELSTVFDRVRKTRVPRLAAPPAGWQEYDRWRVRPDRRVTAGLPGTVLVPPRGRV